jgi:hypothetical protein
VLIIISGGSSCVALYHLVDGWLDNYVILSLCWVDYIVQVYESYKSMLGRLLVQV